MHRVFFFLAMSTAISDLETGWCGASSFPREIVSPAYALSPSSPATPLLEQLPGGETVALVHAYGAGSVVLLLGLNASSALASISAGGLGVVDHLLSRISNDTSPVAVRCGGCKADGTGLQVLSSRSPGGWNITLINDLGVTKEPGTAAVTNPALALNVGLSFRPGFGALAAAWQTTDALIERLAVDGLGAVSVTVPAGGVCVLGLDVQWA